MCWGKWSKAVKVWHVTNLWHKYFKYQVMDRLSLLLMKETCISWDFLWGARCQCDLGGMFGILWWKFKGWFRALSLRNSARVCSLPLQCEPLARYLYCGSTFFMAFGFFLQVGFLSPTNCTLSSKWRMFKDYSVSYSLAVFIWPCSGFKKWRSPEGKKQTNKNPLIRGGGRELNMLCPRCSLAVWFWGIFVPLKISLVVFQTLWGGDELIILSPRTLLCDSFDSGTDLWASQLWPG